MPQQIQDIGAAVDPNMLKAVEELIQSSTALRTEERKYWLDLLPNMNVDQIQQLQSILQQEQENINTIDSKYDRKFQQVGEKYLNKWDAEKARAERLKLKQEEHEHREASQEKAEGLLEKW